MLAVDWNKMQFFSQNQDRQSQLPLSASSSSEGRTQNDAIWISDSDDSDDDTQSNSNLPSFDNKSSDANDGSSKFSRYLIWDWEIWVADNCLKESLNMVLKAARDSPDAGVASTETVELPWNDNASNAQSSAHVPAHQPPPAPMSISRFLSPPSASRPLAASLQASQESISFPGNPQNSIGQTQLVDIIPDSQDKDSSQKDITPTPEHQPPPQALPTLSPPPRVLSPLALATCLQESQEPTSLPRKFQNGIGETQTASTAISDNPDDGSSQDCAEYSETRGRNVDLSSQSPDSLTGTMRLELTPIHEGVSTGDGSGAETMSKQTGNLRLRRRTCRFDGSYNNEEEDNEDDVKTSPPRKRRKAALPAQAAQKIASPRHHSGGYPRSRPRDTRTSLPGPHSSNTPHLGEDRVESDFATFEEWPLEDACLKRVTQSGGTTFQLQFDWDSCKEHRHRRSSPSKQGLTTKATWAGDKKGKLYEVEEILAARTVREVLVKWEGYKKPTWEPLTALKETEAYQCFEELYGPAEENDGPQLSTKE